MFLFPFVHVNGFILFFELSKGKRETSNYLLKQEKRLNTVMFTVFGTLPKNRI